MKKLMFACLGIILTIGFALPAWAGSGGVWHVHNDQTLTNAIAQAAPGHKIVMAPGNYSKLNVMNKNFLRFEAQDAGNKPRIVGMAKIETSSDLTFRRLVFRDSNLWLSGTQRVTIDSCEFIMESVSDSFDSISVVGSTKDIDIKYSWFEGYGAGRAVHLNANNSVDITIQSNTFKNLRHAIWVANSRTAYIYDDRWNYLQGLHQAFGPSNRIELAKSVLSFTSPNYPSDYPPDTIKHGLLIPLGQQGGYWIKIEGNTEVVYDYLDITTTNGHLIERVMGEYRADPHYVWIENTRPVRLKFISDYIVNKTGYKVTTGGNVLDPGTGLANGDWLRSENGDYELIMQHDGNLVLYEISTGQRIPRWDTCTWNQGVIGCRMQASGNLELRTATNNIVWESYTSSPESYLKLENNGRAYIYTSSGNSIWHTSY